MAYLIVPLSVALGLLAIGILARWYLIPRLDRRPRQAALLPLILPHTFRYLGLWFLIPGAVSPSLPQVFARPAGYGDLIASVLALVAAVAVRNRWRPATALVWIFNLWGTADLLNALAQGGMNIGHPGELGAAFLIPALFVPGLLVLHGLIFRALFRPAGDEGG